MLYGTGFAFAVGFVSAALLAGVAFLIYLKTKPVSSDPDLEEAVARVKAAANRVQSGADKVQSETTNITGSTGTVAGIEPGE